MSVQPLAISALQVTSAKTDGEGTTSSASLVGTTRGLRKFAEPVLRVNTAQLISAVTEKMVLIV